MTLDLALTRIRSADDLVKGRLYLVRSLDGWIVLEARPSAFDILQEPALHEFGAKLPADVPFGHDSRVYLLPE